MGGMARKSTGWLLLAAAVGGPAVALLVPLPKGTRMAGIVLNLGHVVLGAVVCVLLWRAMRSLTRSGVLARGAWAWLGAMAVLTGIEFVQGLSKTRNPTLGDIVANGLGATAALLFLVVRRGFLKRLAAAALPVAIALVPTGLEVADTLRQNADFPLLADFESQLEMTRWQFRSATGRRTADGARHGTSALHVRFEPGDWPAAHFAHVAPDWRGYRTLAFEIRADAKRTLLLHAVDRQYDGHYSDRFTRELTLSTQWETVRIPLADIRDGPHKRQLDLERIHSMQWYADHPQQPFSVWLDHVRLEK